MAKRCKDCGRYIGITEVHSCPEFIHWYYTIPQGETIKIGRTKRPESPKDKVKRLLKEAEGIFKNVFHHEGYEWFKHIIEIAKLLQREENRK